MKELEDRRVISILFFPPLLTRVGAAYPVKRRVRFSDGSLLMDSIPAEHYRRICDEFAPREPPKEKDR